MSAIDVFDDLPRFAELSNPADRTMLFSLAPVRLGEPMQESLLSFLVRTSRAHAVNPRRLVGDILAEIDPAIGALVYAGFFKRLAKTMNGGGQYAERFAAVLERTTGVKVLRRLTLLPWRDLFPLNGQGMLADRPQWCPGCLLAQYREVGERYVPLAWTFAAFKVCPTHGGRLERRCPHCGRYQSFIPRYPDVGICSECGKFLVTDAVLSATSHTPPTDLERWAADAVLSMIARQASFSTLPTVDDFRIFVTTAVDKETAGNRSAFCRKIGLPGRALNGWLMKGERPSMAQFLNLCYRLGVSPARIGDVNECEVVAVSSFSMDQIERRRRCPRLTPEQRREIRDRLAAYLFEMSCPPVSRIAADLNVSARCLRYWFPDLCASLSERARVAQREGSATHQARQSSRVGEIVRQLRQAGRYPSRRQVNMILRQESMSLAQPHLLKAYRAAVAS